MGNLDDRPVKQLAGQAMYETCPHGQADPKCTRRAIDDESRLRLQP
jgi:hypothetical protein